MVSKLRIAVFIFALTLSFLNAFNIKAIYGYHRFYEHTGDIEGGKRIWFDVNDTDINMDNYVARLLLYHEANNSDEITNEPYIVNVYRMAHDENNKKILKFVNAKNVPLTKQGFVSITVSSAVKYWLDHAEENFGLSIKIRHPDQPDIWQTPDETGFVNVQSDLHHFRPFILLHRSNMTYIDDDDKCECDKKNVPF